MLDVGLQVSITGLERELHRYTLEPIETPFDLKSVPLAAQPVVEQPATAPGETPAVKTTEKVAATRQDVYAGEEFCLCSQAPCGLRGCKNRPAPFPGRMS